MIKKTVKFENYNGEEETAELYFNLSKGELVEIQFNAINSDYDSLQDRLDAISKSRNGREIIAHVKEIIEMSYGERAQDGKRFIKVDEDGRKLVNRFQSTGAYSELLFELTTDAEKLAEFIRGLVPANLVKEVDKELSSQQIRERSAAQMQGYQQKQEAPKPTVEVLPEPVLTPEPVMPQQTVSQTPDLGSMTPEQLQEYVRNNPEMFRQPTQSNLA